MAGSVGHWNPLVVARSLAGSGDHKRCLAAPGLTEGFLIPSVERGSQLVGDGSLEISSVEDIVGVGGTTRRDWVLQVLPKGLGGEVSRAALEGHAERREVFEVKSVQSWNDPAWAHSIYIPGP